jgi:hypothetical protein
VLGWYGFQKNLPQTVVSYEISNFQTNSCTKFKKSSDYAKLHFFTTKQMLHYMRCSSEICLGLVSLARCGFKRSPSISLSACPIVFSRRRRRSSWVPPCQIERWPTKTKFHHNKILLETRLSFYFLRI